MAFSRPTLTQLVDRISADFETQITGASTLLRRSVLKVMARVLAGAIHLLYGFAEYMSLQQFAHSSDQTYLDRIASEYGIIRIDAVKATGSGTVTGTNDTVVPRGSVLQSTAGQQYATTAVATIASGTATLSLEANVGDVDGNDDPAITLTFINPIVGVSSTCTVIGDGLTGGADQETDALLRARVLSRKQLPPHGGSQNDYITWAKEVAGVTRAWCFPEYNGTGTVAVAFVRDGESPIAPSASERAAVESYIIEHTDAATGVTVGIPVTAEPGFSVLELTEYAIDFQIDLYPNTSTVQTAVETALTSLITNEGGPAETIYVSQIRQAISNALGEGRHRLDSPASDVAAGATQVHVMGTITWGDY